MMKRSTLSFLAAATGLSLITSAGAKERPNILFLFSDDHAPNAISSYPGGLFDKIAPTPGIDRIAKEGLLFTNSFCANAICGPSRACILTGKHSHLNGFLDNNSSHFDGLQQTFPQLLGKTGYQSAMIGKWHLHSNPVGFDFWRILPGQGSYYNPDFVEMDGSRKRYEGHCNDLVKDFALEWLKNGRDKGKPFIAMCQFKAPHRNWSGAERHLKLFDGVTMPEPDTLFDDYKGRSTVLGEQRMEIANHMYWGHDMKFNGENLFPKYFKSGIKNGEYMRMTPAQKKVWDAAYEPRNQKFIADMKAGKLSDKDITRWKYQRYIKDYLRSIRSMDEGIGNILEYLDESGLAKNTIVIYSSDQGFYLGEHGWYDKRWMFEESFKMPFVIRWPGVIQPGTLSTALIQNIDYAPTFLDLCGAAIPDDMQGRSIVPVLKSSGMTPADWRKSFYYHYFEFPGAHSVARHYGVTNGKHKLIHYYGPSHVKGETYDAWELFDLGKDPNELKSVYGSPEYADVRKQLEKEVTRLRGVYKVPDQDPMPVRSSPRPPWPRRAEKKPATR